jgi:chromosome segregation ATPase
LSHLDRSLEAIRNEIRQAQSDVDRATSNIATLKRTQQQLNQDINAGQSRLASLAPDQERLRGETQAQLKTLAGQLGKTAADLGSAENLLRDLVAQRRVELAEQKLEHERGSFLVQVKSLLTSINDGPVRYLFAGAALKAVKQRSIDATGFHNLVDQDKAQEILTDLTRLIDNAREADREEAIRFEKLEHLIEELRSARADFMNASAKSSSAEAALRTKHDSLQSKVADLEKPETPIDSAGRHRLVVIFLAVAILLSIGGVGIFAYAAASSAPADFRAAIAAVLCVLALPAYYAAWRNTDRYRVAALRRHKEALQSASNQLGDLKATREQLAGQTAQQIERFRQELARFGSEPTPTPPVVDSSDPFEPSIARTRRHRDLWQQSHPDVQKLMA